MLIGGLWISVSGKVLTNDTGVSVLVQVRVPLILMTVVRTPLLRMFKSC
jgi:hypothetical protein